MCGVNVEYEKSVVVEKKMGMVWQGRGRGDSLILREISPAPLFCEAREMGVERDGVGRRIKVEENEALLRNVRMNLVQSLSKERVSSQCQ